MGRRRLLGLAIWASSVSERVGLLKRQLAGEHAIEDHAQAVDVAPAIRVVRQTLGLLGRHVGRGAQDLTVDRQRAAVGGVTCQAEVGELGLAPFVNEDVRRLDVAVDDPQGVGVFECPGNLPHQLGGFGGLDRAGAELAAGLEGLATDQLGIDVAQSVVFVRLVERDDVRVTKLGGDPRIALEPLADLGAYCRAVTKDLERDLAVELGIVSQEDH